MSRLVPARDIQYGDQRDLNHIIAEHADDWRNVCAVGTFVCRNYAPHVLISSHARGSAK